MTEKILAAFERRNDPPDDLVIATAKLRSLGQRPYFSLTGDTYEGRRRAESRWMGGGAIGHRLAEVWPDLAPLDALHLADDRGVPMHAEANGWYHLGFTKWVNWGDTQDPYGRPVDRPAILARHYRITVEQAHALHDSLLADHTTPNGVWVIDAARQAHRDWVEVQRPRWDAEARAVLRDIFGVNVRILDPDGVTVWCGASENDAFAAMLRLQSSSVMCATEDQGWTIDNLHEGS